MPVNELDVYPRDGNGQRDMTHPLNSGYNADNARRAILGDRHPSDLDDVFPTVFCKVATGAEILDIQPEPVFDELAEYNFRTRMRDAQWAGSGSSGDDEDPDKKEDSKGCGQNGGNTCVYEVTLSYVTPATLTSVTQPGASCPTAGPCIEGTGRPCTGTLSKECRQFPTRSAAEAAHQEAVIQQTYLWNNCLYRTGQKDPYGNGDTAQVSVLSPPPPPPPKSDFDVTYATPINCGDDTQSFADSDMLDNEFNDPRPAFEHL